MPTVKVSVDVCGAEMSVFHDTLPPVLGSGKLSLGVLDMSFALSTRGFRGLEVAIFVVGLEMDEWYCLRTFLL